MGQLRGCLFVWDTHTLFAAAPGLVNKPHGHYAASMILTPDHPLKLGYGGKTTSAHGFLLAPNLVHQLDASQTRLLVLHLDPDSPEYRAMAPLLGDDAVYELPNPPQITGLDDLISGEVSDQTAEQLFRTLVHNVSGVTPSPVELDPRIPKVLSAIQNHLPEIVSTADLADQVALSPDRLMHLFKAQLGLTIRRYVLWARLRLALQSMRSGGNLTRAAHDAGFSDSAHLSRTFKEMFGMTPSTILGDSRFVQVRFCDP